MRTTLAILLFCGCQAADPGDRGGGAWVMVDRAAATEGWRVRHEDWVESPRLPTGIDPGSPALLRSPRGEETELDLAPGVLAHVRAGGAVEVFEVGFDVPADRLLARGREAAVRELADALNAQATPVGEGFVIEAEGLFELTAFLDVPEAIDEIGPDTGRHEGAAVAGFAIASAHEELAARLVGVYWNDAELLVLNAEGGFVTRRCSGVERTGRVAFEGEQVLLVGDDGVTIPFDRELMKPIGDQ